MINVSDSVHMGLLFDIRNKTANLCKCVFQKNPSEIAALNPFWSELFIWSKSNYLNPSMSAMTSSTHEGAWWCTHGGVPGRHGSQDPQMITSFSPHPSFQIFLLKKLGKWNASLVQLMALFCYFPESYCLFIP